MYGSKTGVKRDKTPQEALEVARWLCSKMERTAQDVRRSLYRWGVRQAEEQDKILETLVAEKFIDHRRYASAYVRSKLSEGRWGASKIAQALKTKGVEVEIIKQEMADSVEPQEMLQNLESDLRKRLATDSLRARNPYDLRQKLFRRAVSRGYEIEDINEVLNKIIADED